MAAAYGSSWKDYLGDFVYGGIDGCVTTFAVVAGASGAGLDSSIVIILGFANLLADGFAMSIGAYLSERTDQENHRQRFSVPEQEPRKRPLLKGAATWIAFLLVGLIPLLIYVMDYWNALGVNLFLWASVLTAAGFVLIGWLKARVTGRPIFRSIAETLLLGTLAALVAYFTGDWLETLIR